MLLTTPHSDKAMQPESELELKAQTREWAQCVLQLAGPRQQGLSAYKHRCGTRVAPAPAASAG